MPDAPPTVLDVRIRTQLDLVRPVRKVIEALLASLGWSEDDVADVGLVATEVIQNAVEHGSKNDGSETVEVRCWLDGGEAIAGAPEEADWKAGSKAGSKAGLIVEVADPGTGKGADSLLSRDVTVPPPEDSSRGRGLYLVHRMAARMDRGRMPGGGSVVSVLLRATAS
jgi:anti-sigma regulatory factor (Ser/Thr protein kinase)